MTIGFDAKRAYHNTTGLGNYSRTLISSLAKDFTHDQFLLYNPKNGNFDISSFANVKEIQPTSIIDRLFPAVWRSYRISKQIDKQVDLYHGLSNELPFGIQKCKAKKVVTMHDLIFEFYPEQYQRNDIAIYQKKCKHACAVADKIIAISEATKKDLIEIYKVSPQKIEVCYQSCDQRFFNHSQTADQNTFSQKFNLHKPYFLFVGSIIARKNLLHVCHAFLEVAKHQDIDLVVVGKGNAYKQLVIDYLTKNKALNKVHFLEDHFNAKDIYDSLPELYQKSLALVYPSYKEGFGIPILEAMASGTAVITSSVSSLQEVAGDAAICVEPDDVHAIANAMQSIVNDSLLRTSFIQKGFQRAAQFSNKNTAQQTMNIYKQII
ncbi:MAG: glycosyltransferase family 4 protein [Bacteroidetes bacterium]|nr:glycosyltransferase family 4 protein [Bacteroidota bacterium]